MNPRTTTLRRDPPTTFYGYEDEYIGDLLCARCGDVGTPGLTMLHIGDYDVPGLGGAKCADCRRSMVAEYQRVADRYERAFTQTVWGKLWCSVGRAILRSMEQQRHRHNPQAHAYRLSLHRYSDWLAEKAIAAIA